MEKVKFTDPDTKEECEFFVVDETTVGGIHYLFVTEEEDGDSDAYLLKELSDGDEDAVYALVDDGEELKAVGKVFAELIEDADIGYYTEEQ